MRLAMALLNASLRWHDSKKAVSGVWPGMTVSVQLNRNECPLSRLRERRDARQRAG